MAQEKDAGWFPVFRSLYSNPEWFSPSARDPSNRRDAWVALLSMAAFEPRDTPNSGRLERGEFVASLRTLAKLFCWHRSRVERFICELETRTAIGTVRETPDGTVYRIVGYDTYATATTVDRDSERDKNRDSGETAARQDKEVKKLRTKKLLTPTDEFFERAMNAYPKREGGSPKGPALRAWTARIREGIDPTALVEGVERYRRYCDAQGMTGGRFVKHAATFFGPDRHWEHPYQTNGNGSGASHHDPMRLRTLR